MKTSTVATILAGCFLGSASLPADALDIKGLEVDKPADCRHVGDISNYDAWQGCKSEALNFIVNTSFLGYKVDIFVTRDSAMHVSALRLEGFDFDQARSALSAKYGRPKSRQSSIQNAMGAKFAQTELTWESDRAVLTLRQHGDKIGTSSLSLLSKEAMLKFLQKRDGQKSDI